MTTLMYASNNLLAKIKPLVTSQSDTPLFDYLQRKSTFGAHYKLNPRQEVLNIQLESPGAKFGSVAPVTTWLS